MPGTNKFPSIAIPLLLVVCPFIGAQPPGIVASALKQGNYNQAVQAANDLLARNATDPQLWTLRGIALSQLHRLPESLSSFDRALAASPGYLPALEAAAEITYTQHDRRAAEFLTRIVKEDEGNQTAHAMLGALAAETNDCPAAIREFARAPDATRQNRTALLQYGDCLLSEQKTGSATAAFRQAFDILADDETGYKLALALKRCNRSAEAISVLDKLPAVSRTLNLRASCQVALSNWQGVVEDLRRAIAMAPRDEQNYVDLGSFYVEHKQPQLAVDLITQALVLLPHSARLYTIRGAAYTWLNDTSRAAENFARADDLEPQRMYGSVGQSMLLRQTEHTAEATKILRTRVAASPQDATLTYLLADTLIRAGAEPGQPDFDESILLLERSIKLDSNLERARVLLGKLYIQVRRPEDALWQFRETVRLDPGNRSALTQLILLLRQTGRTNEASVAASELRTLVTNSQKEN